MKIQMESTPAITDLNGVPVRVWNGVTEKGIPCLVFVHRLAVHLQRDATQFDAELQEQLAPGFVPIDQLLAATPATVPDEAPHPFDKDFLRGVSSPFNDV